MSEENAPQKERFLREVEQQLLRKELDAKLLEDGLIHVRWNERPLCSVDRDGIVRFRPADITGPDVDTIYLARWCSRLARQPVTLEVDSSSLFRVAIMCGEASLSRLNMPL